MASDLDDYLRYLRDRERQAATFRIRTAEAIGDVKSAEKALGVVAAMDVHRDGDIGSDADDARAELHDAARHLQNVLRIAIGHERDVRDEIAAAEKDADRG
jgi:hypothetical protein